MTDKLPDVWAERDFPVLAAATRLVDEGAQDRGLGPLTDASGLEVRQVVLALKALERRGLITASASLAGIDGVLDVAGEAYLLTGLHPDGDNAVSQLISTLNQAAEQTTDPEEKSRIRKLADAAGGVSRDVLTGVLTAFITAAGRGAIG